jgi:hypothetical protein
MKMRKLTEKYISKSIPEETFEEGIEKYKFPFNENLPY